jgi:hypothetical protein
VLLALLEHYRASDEQQRAVNAELHHRVHEPLPSLPAPFSGIPSSEATFFARR